MGQSANISCVTNIPVTSIQWSNETSVLKSSSADNLTVLEYTIPLVRDDLQGQRLTCTPMAGATTYTETRVVEVKGMTYKCIVCGGSDGLFYYSSSSSTCWVSESGD